MKKFGLNKEDYRRKGSWTPTTNFSPSTDLRQVYNDITYEAHEILHQISFHTTDRQNHTVTQEFTAASNDSDLLQVVTKYQGSNLGRRYSIRPKDSVLGRGIFAVDFVARLGIHVYLGYPGQFMYMSKTKVRKIFKIFIKKISPISLYFDV